MQTLGQKKDLDTRLSICGLLLTLFMLTYLIDFSPLNTSPLKRNHNGNVTITTQYSMGNIFVKKPCTKSGGKLFPDPLLKNQN